MNNRPIPKEKLLASSRFSEEEAYWVDCLSGELPHSGFSFPEKSGERRLEDFSFTFAPQIGSRLVFMANKSPIRMYMILVAGIAATMERYRYENRRDFDVVVGSVTAKPKSGEVDISKLLNTLLLLRVKCENSREITFKRLLMAIRETFTAAVKNQAYPLEVLPARPGISYTREEFDRFFDVMVLLESIHDERFSEAAHVIPNFTIIFKDNGETVSGRIRFNSLVYDPREIESIAENLEHLFNTALFEIEKPLSQIPVLPESQLHKLVNEYNNTAARYPHDQTIHGIFEACVKKYPDHTAVTDPEKGDISYDRLNKAANRIAHRLRQHGVTPGTPVALIMEPSMEMVASILGTLKAGGGYLPLDPKHPASRINSILDDCKPPVVLTREGVLKYHAFSALQGLRQTVEQPVLTAPCPQVADMDDLPWPNRGLVDYDKYNKYIGQAMVKHCMALQGSRGCPYNCVYCHKIMPKNQVIRSAQNLFDEVKLYYDMGVRRFAIIDDIFNLDIKTSSAFFRMIIDRRMKVQLFFPNGLRGDIMTEEYIDLMVEAGTASVALALETASPRLQKLIKKNLDLERFEANLGYFLKKYPKVILELFTMHGFPTETEAEAMMTLDFIRRQQWLHFPYVHILKIYPDTDMAALAIENGVSHQAIAASADLAYHELPDTLPFDKTFTLNYQTEFLNGYFLNKDRLRHVLPRQMEALTVDELVEKYDSYLPADIGSFNDLLDFTGITRDELHAADFLDESAVIVPDLDRKIKAHFPPVHPPENAMRVLLLDLSQHFSHEEGMLYDVVEPPLGLMYVMTYLNREFGDRIHGNVWKARIDFNDYSQLKELIDRYEPHVIGLRALSFYKDNIHRTAAAIRQWGITVPIIAGGPYATCDYPSMLQDPNIDLAVIGEGERITARLIGAMLENDFALPTGDALKEIPGIAYMPGVGESRHRIDKSCGRRAVMVVDWDLIRNTAIPDTNPEPASTADDLAYIIFTSGSTGKPKGVMVEHRNVVRLMTNDRYPFTFSQNDVWTLFHSYCFDFSVWEMYGALLYGGKLIVFPRSLSRDTEAFIKLLKNENVTVLNQTPSAFYLLSRLEAMDSGNRDLKLRYVIFGGEALNPSRLNEFHDRYPHTRLVNMFGITETTVHVTFKAIGDEEIQSGASNIGKPIPTLRIYILDSQGRLLPPGVSGEIFIGGDGVARGYVNQVEMTTERFIDANKYELITRAHGEGTANSAQNGFVKEVASTSNLNSPEKNKELVDSRSNGFDSRRGTMSRALTAIPSPVTLYKSGDLGRWLPNGDLEYIGRIDQQVQVRGFRVELGEIESRLMAHDNVRSVAVVPGWTGKQEDDIYLCGYVVPANGSWRDKDSAGGIEELKHYLSRWLPEYMVPAYFVFMGELPLTSNGKLDRKALPDARTSQTGTGESIAPRDNIERNLADIWREVLELPDQTIGIRDNFFDLGGHSLKATILAAKIHKTFDVKIPLVDLFQEPTIEGVANHIRLGDTETYSAIPVAGEKENYSLSSAQKRLYIANSSEPGGTGYNISLVVELEGELDVRRFDDAFYQLIGRHESFRTSFKIVDHRPVQVIHPHVDFAVEHLNGGHDADPVIADFVRPFDLSRAPLLRVGLVGIQPSAHVLILDVHHIVNDGYSMITLIREFSILYRGGELPPLSLRYRDYSEWMTWGKGREAVKKQESYWLERFERPVRELRLPYDFSRSDSLGAEGAEMFFHIHPEQVAGLNRLAREHDLTLFMILLGLLNVLLSKIGGTSDVIVGTAVTGRRHADLESVVGMFVNTLALRNTPEPDKTVIDFLKEVGKNTLADFENQDFQFEDLVDRLHLPRRVGRNPLFDVMFELQNIGWPNLELPGLTLKPRHMEIKNAKFDLTFNCMETNGYISVSVSYNTNLFKAGTIERFTGYFRKIVTSVLENPERKISQIELVSQQKHDQVQSSFNEDLEDE